MAQTKPAAKPGTNKLIPLVLSALFAAMITVMTAFLFHIPIGVNGGYLHFGDALIYLAASLLPTPYACAAAAVGAGLADIVSGAPVWAPFTLVIKACIVLLFTAKREKLLNKRNVLALIGAWPVTCAGYYVAEAIITGNWVVPAAGLPANTIQAAGSAVLFVLIALALDKMHLKNRLKLS